MSKIFVIHHRVEKAYWRSRGNGLTPDKRLAYRYNEEQAESIVTGTKHLEAIEVSG